jgi:hypothetical protein
MTIKHTNDAMFETLRAMYPTVAPTLGDLLAAFWAERGLENRGWNQYQFYVTYGAPGTTLGDAANNYWADGDYRLFNLEFEDGTDMLLEDGNFMVLETGNV